IFFLQVEVLDAKTREQLCFLDKVCCFCSYTEGKSLRDDEILQNLPVGTTATMYFKDLGPQLGWTMVFLAEYIGPLLSYLLFYFRIPYFYSNRYALSSSPHPVVTLACVCHTFHYTKRLIETIFVHRFSHGTMPLRTIVKNCAYYWGFSAWLAYYINHPLYTPPCKLLIYLFLGDGESRFPMPNKNPFTWLFFFVSCPNYTYEVGAWVSFSIMTQCLPVAFYTLLGFIQMTIWAKGKHRAYIREFKDYPSLRVAIIPLIL
uniref:Very-long-chain enoyl-CoA reductase-like n=1 Tax=Haplochromis burtoni TaxID=8153 RepID=A0A3Q3BZT6_HAPBU